MMTINEDLTGFCKELVSTTDIRYIRVTYRGDSEQVKFNQFQCLRSLQGIDLSTVGLNKDLQDELEKILVHVLDKGTPGWRWDTGSSGSLCLDVQKQEFDIWESRQVWTEQNTRYMIKVADDNTFTASAEEV